MTVGAVVRVVEAAGDPGDRVLVRCHVFALRLDDDRVPEDCYEGYPGLSFLHFRFFYFEKKSFFARKFKIAKLLENNDNVKKSLVKNTHFLLRFDFNL